MFLWQQKFQHVPHCRIQPIWRYYFYKSLQYFFPHNLTLSNSVCFLLNVVQWKNVKNLLLQERERLFDVLKGIPFLKPFPSHSNFILCEVTSGKDAKKIKVRFPCYYTLLLHTPHFHPVPLRYHSHFYCDFDVRKCPKLENED